MKKFVILMLFIIVVLAGILGMKIINGNTPTTNANKNYSITDISSLLEKGKNYKNYYCEYDKLGQHSIRKVKDNKMVIIGDDITSYIDYSTNKQTVVSEKRNTAITSNLDSNKLIAINKTYFQEVIDSVNDTSNYNYKYIKQENVNNFDCAKIELSSTKIYYNVWIDISSGLVTKLYCKNIETSDEITTEFNLKLDCVTDSEVNVPDLKNYRVMEM